MTMPELRCRACGTLGLRAQEPTYEVPGQSCTLFPTAEAARACPQGLMALGQCPQCGLVQNTQFDPALVPYTSEYDGSQAFSRHFSRFSRDFAARLVERYQLRGKLVIDVGCGNGEFLVDLLEAGAGAGLGIDPSADRQRVPERWRGALKLWAGPLEAVDVLPEAGLICCRHTLEHIAYPRAFMAHLVELSAAAQTPLMVDIPDTARVWREGAYWDVYYEHCNYFDEASLRGLLIDQALRCATIESDFAGQFLVAHLQHGVAGGAQPAWDRHALQGYLRLRDEQLAKWRRRLIEAADRGHGVALWGAGSKAIAFCTAFAEFVRSGLIRAAVDVNPHKQGRYLPGSGLRVIPPGELVDVQPELLVIMNPVYLTEIDGDIGQMGLDLERVAL